MKLLKSLRSLLGSALNYRLRINRGGSKFFIPVVAGVGRAHLDNHEPHIAEILRRIVLIHPDSMLVDVGANIGQTLIQFATVVGKSCKYIGFEPNIQAAAYLEKLIDLNGFKNAYLIATALGQSPQLGQLLVGSKIAVDPGASMNPQFRDGSFYNTYKYALVSVGDEIIRSLITSENLIIKIDAEGYELEVLRGFISTIRISRPIIIIEILPPSEFSDQVAVYRVQRRNEIFDYMSVLNYAGRQIGSTHEYLFVPADFDIVRYDLN